MAVCAMLFAAHASFAQQQTVVVTDGAEITGIDMRRSSGRLFVTMDLDLTDMKIKSNKSLRLTPVVTDGDEMVQLPAVVVDGRRRYMVRERQRDGMFPSDNMYVRRHNRKAQVVEYESDIPYEPWMDNSQLVLREEWCSCHDMTLSEEFVTVAAMTPAPRTDNSARQPQAASASKPRMAYATPPADTKSRSRQGSAAVFFPVNKSDIQTAYMGNGSELDTIRNTVAAVNGNAANSIAAVRLTGYASPEGPYGFNKALAARRADAVKKYLVDNKLVDPSLITADSAPVNWDALKRMLMQSCINDYRRIVAVIDDPSIKPENKNAEIRRRFPVEYDFMLRTWYPKLRVTDYTVDYNVRPYSVDEAKRLVRTNPSMLSPAEIYMVALTYDKGSKEWKEIILIAVQTYPESPEARVNAANVAMADGNYAQAAAYLDGVPAGMPEAMNSRGILAMSQGDYARAMNLFRQAQKAGINEATYNISLLHELMQLKN